MTFKSNSAVAAAAALVLVSLVSVACKPQSAPKPKKQAADAGTGTSSTTTTTRPDGDDSQDLLLKIEAVGFSGTELTVAPNQTLKANFRVTGATISADVAVALDRAVSGVTLNAASVLAPSLTWTPALGTTTEQIAIIVRDMRKCERFETSASNCVLREGGYKSSYDIRQNFTLKVGNTGILGGGGGNNSQLITQILPILTGMLSGGGGGDLTSILNGMNTSQLQGILGGLTGGSGGSGGFDINTIIQMLQGSGLTLKGEHEGLELEPLPDYVQQEGPQPVAP
jgi:hypothetical protein